MPGSGRAYGYNNGLLGKQHIGVGPRSALLTPKHRIENIITRYNPQDGSNPPAYGLTYLYPNPVSNPGLWSLSEVSAYKRLGIWSGMVTSNLIFYFDLGVRKSYPVQEYGSWGASPNGYSATYNDIMAANTLTIFAGNESINWSTEGKYAAINLDGATTWNINYTSNTGNNFTAIAWCKPTANGQSGGSDVFAKNYNASVGAPYVSWGFDYLSTNKFRFSVANNLAWNPVSTTGTYAINNVYCVALTYGDNTSSRVVRGYVNSGGTMTQDATITNTANPAYNTGATWISSVVNLANNYFTGEVYAVMLYSTCLTQSELQQNFDAMRGRFSL